MIGFAGYTERAAREHPIEDIAREQAWTGTAHGLVGELGDGAK